MPGSLASVPPRSSVNRMEYTGAIERDRPAGLWREHFMAGRSRACSRRNTVTAKICDFLQDISELSLHNKSPHAIT